MNKEVLMKVSDKHNAVKTVIKLNVFDYDGQPYIMCPFCSYKVFLTGNRENGKCSNRACEKSYKRETI